MAKGFSAKDEQQLRKTGISLQNAQAQIARLKRGFPFVQLIRSCTVGDGILRLPVQEQKRYESQFKKRAGKIKTLKFVPASGAASRMFQFLESNDPKHAADKQKFLQRLPDFAFYKELAAALKKRGKNIEALRRKGDLAPIVEMLLQAQGLGYREAPKGMILFHGAGKNSLTAFQEHLHEATILKDAKNRAHLHFTLPAAARANVKKHLKKSAAQIKKAKFDLSDSVQSPATGQLALEKNGTAVRDDKGGLLLRPAGHGALLQNLDKLRADAIFVKNIDNIQPRNRRTVSDKWKRILGGVFFDLQDRLFLAQRILAAKKTTPRNLIFVLKLAQELGWDSKNTGKLGARKALEQFFNRPLRVCGMVPNSGEPGGGPFWASDAQGHATPQIVESAEVNLNDAKQKKIWGSSSHFNPVDFVCGVYNYRGKKYNLATFVNGERGMISKKNFYGREIKVMELPGLWNGAMSDWLTLFVEIPAAVFSPVKTVLDLLRPEHQA